MRILFLATYFPDPQHPSRGNWALEQARAFAEAGYSVKVMVPTSYLPKFLTVCGKKFRNHLATPKTWNSDGLEICYPRWPYYPWQLFRKINGRFPRTLLRLAWPWLKRGTSEIIEDFHPDIVFAHHTLVSGQVARLIHDNWKVPYVVTDHEVGDLLECGRNPAVRAAFEWVAEKARAMVVVSHGMKEAGRIRLPGIDFKVIHNGSSFPIFRRDTYRPTGKPLTLFSCAKFYGRKDIPLLIEAFDRVADTLDIRLRIAGDGPDRLHIKEVVQAARHRDRIELLGLVDSNTVREEMESADIFALVGWAEPFGVVFLEAMATGLPVIVCKDAGIAEVLEDGKTAVFTKPRDRGSVISAISRLAEDDSLRKTVGLAGQQLFENRFRWPVVLEQYRALMTP